MAKIEENPLALKSGEKVPNYQIKKVSRELMEKKILMSMEEEDRVAIVVNKKSLEALIAVCKHYELRGLNDELRALAKDLSSGMEQLLKVSF